MVQKTSEASSPNSLGPKWDWPEMRGEEYRPRTVLSWLLAKWVMGESEEAGRRTLSSHGPENPEEKEIALSLRKVGTETKDSPPGPPPGKERRCSRRLLRKSKLQHLRVACVRAASSTSWATWGLAGTWGVPLSCERLDALTYVSIQPGAEQLWRAPTATGRLRPVSLQALDGRRGWFLQVAAFRGHKCTAIALCTWGMPAYPLATLPSRVARMEEADEGPSTTLSAPHAPPGRKAPGQSAVVSRTPLRETNRPAARARDWAVY